MDFLFCVCHSSLTYFCNTQVEYYELSFKHIQGRIINLMFMQQFGNPSHHTLMSHSGEISQSVPITYISVGCAESEMWECSVVRRFLKQYLIRVHRGNGIFYLFLLFYLFQIFPPFFSPNLVGNYILSIPITHVAVDTPQRPRRSAAQEEQDFRERCAFSKAQRV